MVTNTLVFKKTYLIFFIAGLMSACSPTASDSAAEGNVQMENTSADTASVDAAGSAVETLPSVEPSVAAPLAATPSPDPVPPTEVAPTPATTSEQLSYTVKKGDTLMSIAFNIYGDVSQWKTLHETNRDGLKNANVLTPGMALKYQRPASDPVIERNGDPYKIKKGDTLGTIADDIYGKKQKWKKIWENNKTLIKDPNKIYAGFYVYYQITEEERSEAEKIKSTRQAMNKIPAPAAPAATTAPVASAAPASASGGLQGLVENPDQTKSNRVPASQAK